MKWRKYWKFFSVLPGAALMVLTGTGKISVADSQAIDAAISAVIAAAGPLIAPKNAD